MINKVVTQNKDTRTTHAHELVDGATNMSDKFLKSDWITAWRFVPRLELTFPLIVTRPLQQMSE